MCHSSPPPPTTSSHSDKKPCIRLRASVRCRCWRTDRAPVRLKSQARVYLLFCITECRRPGTPTHNCASVCVASSRGGGRRRLQQLDVSRLHAAHWSARTLRTCARRNRFNNYLRPRDGARRQPLRTTATLRPPPLQQQTTTTVTCTYLLPLPRATAALLFNNTPSSLNQSLHSYLYLLHAYLLASVGVACVACLSACPGKCTAVVVFALMRAAQRLQDMHAKVTC